MKNINKSAQMYDDGSYGDGGFFTIDGDSEITTGLDDVVVLENEVSLIGESNSAKDSYDIEHRVEEKEGADLILVDLNEDEEDVVIEGEPVGRITFTVPLIPGAADDSELPDEESETVSLEDVETTPGDIWDWSKIGHAGVLDWAKGMVESTPRHSGRDVSGLERAISWIERVIKELSKAMRTDYRGEIDTNDCETMRDGLEESIVKMNDRLSRVRALKYPRYKKTKTAGFYSGDGLVKEAQKAPLITGITVTVPLFIARLARVLINGTVSAGHSIEDMYDSLKEEYDLTKREEAELQQLVADMGYPVFQDRGIGGEITDRSRSDNYDWAASYRGV